MPRFGGAVPFSLHEDQPNDLVNVADALADMGVLTPDQWTGDLVRSCILALEEWSSHVQGFSKCSIELAPTPTEEIRVDSREGSDDYGAFAITNNTHIPDVRVMRPRICLLEEKVKGVAQLILSTLDDADFNVFTPHVAFRGCQWIHWRSGEDEKAYKRIVIEEDGQEEWDSMNEEGIITVADWTNDMPGWAFNPKPVTIPQSEKDKLPELFHLIGKIRSFKPVNQVNEIEYNVPHNAPIIVEWKGYDMTSQLFDDLYNYSMQGSEDNIARFGLIRFNPCDKDSIRTAVKRLDSLLRHMTDVHQLVQMISDPRKEP